MKKYGLIGYPLSHSFSKDYFNEKFRKEGIEGVEYHNFPLENIEDFEDFKNDEELFGVNVTIPYKERIVKYLDVLSEDAREIQAVNTVCMCRKTGRLARVGHNTDVIGFRRSLEENMENQLDKALVLGTGGASKAIIYVLKQKEVEVVLVSSSDREGAIAYSEIDAELLKSCSLIVNTTPLGMFPNIDEAPDIPYEYLTSRHLLFDLVYNPEETLFLKKGRKQGSKTVNGLKMLEYQAEASWEIWNRK